MTPLDLFRAEGICTLPVDIKCIARRQGINIYTYREFGKMTRRNVRYLYNEYGPDGFSAVSSAGRRMIVYNEQRAPGRIRWTLAHEFAHHLLGHVVPASRGGTQSPEEREADRFAKQLLAPLPVLFACEIHSAAEVARVTRLSVEASRYRLQDLTFYHPQSEYDLDMIDHFSPYIQCYREVCAPDMQDLMPYKYRVRVW